MMNTVADKPERTERIERKQAHREGELAFERQVPMGEAPYGHKDNRYLDWLGGWLDARTRKRLGHVFEKWGMKYP